MNMRVLLAVLWSLLLLPARADSPREHTRIDANWKFFLGDPANAQAPEFDDSAWRGVVLPHDWSIEGKFDAKAPMGGPGGFLPSGVGWYRYPIDAPAAWNGRHVSVEFEGVYMNADVWCNGRHLITHPYGYTGFNVDLTASLKPGGKNVLAVRVDNSEEKNSRWYSGSGIYRHVWLTVSGPVHVIPWGIFVSTPQADAQTATISTEIQVVNETADAKSISVETSLLGPDGTELSKVGTTGPIAGNETQKFHQLVKIKNPPLWSPEKPQLSRAVTRILEKGQVVDEVTTTFGLRTLAWSADKGFLINGVAVKLNGGCIHHDNGVLGAMAFDRAEERKVEILKASGFNEIRTSHNPPSPELLDACDRLGLLVMEEAFDCWAKGKNKYDYNVVFKDWWPRDIDAMVQRDRNHPSVVLWSIGNEIPDLMHAMGAEYGPQIADRVRLNDKTRPVTNGILGFPKPGETETQKDADINWNSLDIVGTNYSMGSHIAQHDQFPNRIVVGTESSPGNPGGLWRQVHDHAYVVGDNVWTAMDYLGESGIGRWFYAGDPTEPLNPPKTPGDTQIRPAGHGDDRLFPWHGALSGDIDILGNRKPMAHLRNIVWDKGETIYLAVEQPDDGKKLITVGWGWHPTWDSWTWPGWEGKQMTVEVYSRYPTARLYLNDKLIGENDTNDRDGFRTSFTVPYAAGTLKAAGVQDGKEMASYQLATVGEAAALRLTPDRTEIKADGQDLSFVKVEALDKAGQLQPNADQDVTFALDGPGTIAGLGSADMKSEDPYQGTHCHLFHGVALVVLRSSAAAGSLKLQAQAGGLGGATAQVETK